MPESVAVPLPGVNATPPGSASNVLVIAGAGTPEAVTLKLPALPIVNVVLFALVKAGGTGVGWGVAEFEVADATLVRPPALVAVTVHVYAWPLTSPLTTMGEPAPVFDPVGRQLAV